ncbi:MAG TPA: multicopper oxidase family protein [Crenotrichaceae bacterium]|nr:multicopper oxidase family protein [Crenotrichaceae bacterium]
MNKIMNKDRRNLLKYAGAVSALASYPSFVAATSSGIGNKPSADFIPDVEIRLTLNTTEVPVLKGAKTSVWKITGRRLKGPATCVDNHANSYLGPTIRLHKGQKVRIHLINNLSSQTILHWHGMHVPADMDGNPRYAINRGETYVYEFEVLNRAGTYWYHAHTHNYTGSQVIKGLAGLMLVSDDEEQALKLPDGEFDIPLVLQDRTFDHDNQLVYTTHMMQRMMGFLGDQILVNGQPDFVLPVARSAYRLRLLNGSNSRIYKLAWDDGTPMTVIGVDGGLLEHPQQYPYIMLAPAERRELWVDFRKHKIGTELTMRSTSYNLGMQGGMMRGRMGGGMMGGRGGGMMGGMRRGGMMGRGMMQHSSLPSGSDYPIFKIQITKKTTNSHQLPSRLTKIPPLQLNKADNADNPRSIALSMRHMSALLNGRSYKMNDVKPDEIIPLNSLQVIAFDNNMHGMMSMPHPMHLHGEQFQIIKRELNPAFSESYHTVKSGIVDNGWHDTVMVMPGEKVTVLKPFNDYKGMFMYHCHNLEHEDLGMMRDFRII